MTDYIFETSRLYLRHWLADDDEPFAKINADPEVMRYLPRQLNREESDQLRAKIVQKITRDRIGFWAVEQKQSRTFIGFTGIAHVTNSDLPFAPSVEIGWRLAHFAWGQGYASEAARICLEYAFNKLQLPQVVALTAVNNQRSRAVMERIGMNYDPQDDFDHPALTVDHPLKRHVLYRINHPEFLS